MDSTNNTTTTINQSTATAGIVLCCAGEHCLLQGLDGKPTKIITLQMLGSINVLFARNTYMWQPLF